VTLVDTSVWIEFFRGPGRASGLTALLETGEVLLHPFVLGELAIGNLGPDRRRVLRDLEQLPRASAVSDGEVLHLIEARTLFGRGIGWIDAHLLAAALTSAGTLWTLDRRLAAAAAKLKLPSLS
jgi:predicted nucleic acid-binding protein